jgi:hypothetical protein
MEVRLTISLGGADEEKREMMTTTWPMRLSG